MYARENYRVLGPDDWDYAGNEEGFLLSRIGLNNYNHAETPEV
jgi:hypothetical protein